MENLNNQNQEEDNNKVVSAEEYVGESVLGAQSKESVLKKKFPQVWGLVILLVITLIMSGLYMYTSKQSSEIKNVDIPNIDWYANWKTYENSKYGYKINYLTECEIENYQSKDDLVFVTPKYGNDNCGYSIQVTEGTLLDINTQTGGYHLGGQESAYLLEVRELVTQNGKTIETIHNILDTYRINHIAELKIDGVDYILTLSKDIDVLVVQDVERYEDIKSKFRTFARSLELYDLNESYSNLDQNVDFISYNNEEYGFIAMIPDDWIIETGDNLPEVHGTDGGSLAFITYEDSTDPTKIVMYVHPEYSLGELGVSEKSGEVIYKKLEGFEANDCESVTYYHKLSVEKTATVRVSGICPTHPAGYDDLKIKVAESIKFNSYDDTNYIQDGEFLSKITRAEGRYLTLDYIEDDTLPNLKIVEMHSDPSVILDTYSNAENGNYNYGERVPAIDFINSFSEKHDLYKPQDLRYLITIEDGLVVKVREQYQP